MKRTADPSAALGMTKERTALTESACWMEGTAGPSTSLRSRRDDNSFVTLTFPIVNRCSTLSGFTIGADDVIIGAPGAAGSAYIVVQAVGGFTGNVTMSAAVTSSPAGPHDPPTFSYNNTNPVDVTPTNFNATLVVHTSKPMSNVQPSSARRISWYSAGGASLACLLLVGVGKQARRWRTMLGAVLMLLWVSSAMMACGGGGNNTGPPPPADPARHEGIGW
jgi:hypothetical protein